MADLSRRDVLKTASAVPLAAWLQAARNVAPRGTPDTRFKRAVLVSMLPKELSWQDRFALARAVGFDGIEMQTVTDHAEAEAIAKASEATGLVIHSVMNSDHWRYPLSSPDPEVVKKSVAGMKTSLMNAALWKAGIVLLVPAVVDAKTSYSDAWSRSVPVIRDQLIPIASGVNVRSAPRERFAPRRRNGQPGIRGLPAGGGDGASSTRPASSPPASRRPAGSAISKSRTAR